MDKSLRHSILILFFYCGMHPGITASASMEQGEPPRAVNDTVRSGGLQPRILYSILDLQFERADSLLDVSRTMSGDSPETVYLAGYREFLDALIGGSRTDFETFTETYGQGLEILQNMTGKHAESFTCISGLHLQFSLLCAYHGENFRAARHYYYAYHYLKKSEDRNAGDPVNYRNRGLITLLGGSVPEEYAWLLRLLGIRGDIAGGLGYLQEYYTASSGAERLEADLLLRIASLTFGQGKETGGEPVYRARYWQEDPEEDRPGYGGRDPGDRSACSPVKREAATLYLYVAALEDLAGGRSDAVVEELRDYRQAAGERAFPYLNLLLGEAMLNGLDTSAIRPLQLFAEHCGGLHYRHYVWHKIGWCYALMGQWEQFGRARQQVLKCGEPYLDADRQALSETMDSLPLNIVLLKSRLFFDGGYYRRALAVLGKVEFPEISPGTGSPVPGETGPVIPLPNRRDSVEYSYRLARIYDRLGERDLAIRYYRQVLEGDPGPDRYFVPNSALHMGLIYEASGETEKALVYYRECLKIDRSAYKRSIDYKARQGIRRLESLQKLQ